MADYTLSIDAGNGLTVGLKATKSGKFKRDAFASVRAVVTGDTLNLNDLERRFDWYEWNGVRYAVGNDVTASSQPTQKHQGANRYGNEFHKFLVAVSAARLGIKKGSIDLTVFAPPGLYNMVSADVIERMSGPVTIATKDDKKPREFTIDTVRLWPEGLAAAACFIFTPDGVMAKPDYLKGRVLFLDGGMYTLDALTIENGALNADALTTSTHEKVGIQAMVFEPILHELKAQGGFELSLLTVADVERAIRNGLTGGEYILRYGGKAIDLKNALDRHSERFAASVADILDSNFDGLRGYKSVMLIGGFVPFVEQWLKQWFTGQILTPADRSEVKKIHPVDMNAAGGLRLALMRQGVKA